MTARRWVRPAVTVVLAVGLVLVAVELNAQAGELDRLRLPGPAGLVAVVTLAVVGQLAFGLVWDRLLPEIDDGALLAWSFHGSQPAKYVPVGVAQPLGQVALLGDRVPSTGRAAVAWVTQILAIVVAGLFLGAGLAVVGDGDGRLLALLGLLAPVLVARPVLAGALHGLGRVWHRIPDRATLPPQSTLLAGFAAAVVAVGAHGTAFAVVAGGDPPAQAALAYALAVGISTATPLPAGLGVREAVIVAASGLAANVALSAALVLRVVLLVVELALFGLSYLLVRRRRAGAPPAPG